MNKLQRYNILSDQSLCQVLLRQECVLEKMEESLHTVDKLMSKSKATDNEKENFKRQRK